MRATLLTAHAAPAGPTQVQREVRRAHGQGTCRHRDGHVPAGAGAEVPGHAQPDLASRHELGFVREHGVAALQAGRGGIQEVPGHGQGFVEGDERDCEVACC
jgi:hypothetical protein